MLAQIFSSALLVVALFFSALAQAQVYPSKPIKILVGFPAGGGADVLARLVGAEMSEAFGQPVIVENPVGAGGTIAAGMVAKAVPDGHTLLLCNVGSMTIDVHLEPKPSYDSLRDFAPVGLMVVNDGVLLVNNSFPANSLSEFVAVLKKSPGKHQIAVSNIGGPMHLGAELLKSVAGLDAVIVPYKGDAQMLTDIVGGHIQIGLPVMASVSQQVKGGQVKAVAALGERRFSAFPDLPTVSEQGFATYTAGSWLGLVAPAGTPPAVIQKLNAAIRSAMAKPHIVKAMNDAGSRIVAGSSEEFSRFISAEHKKWGDVIRKANIKRN